MRFTLIILLTFILAGCSVTQKYNEYAVRVNTINDSDYEEHVESVKLRVSSNKKKVTVKYEDRKDVYYIVDYHYTYPRYKIFKSRKDRTGITLKTADEITIHVSYISNHATIDIPMNDSCDLTRTLISFYYTDFE